MKLTEAKEILVEVKQLISGGGHTKYNEGLDTAINALQLLDDIRTDSTKKCEDSYYAVVQMTRMDWREIEKLK